MTKLLPHQQALMNQFNKLFGASVKPVDDGNRGGDAFPIETTSAGSWPLDKYLFHLDNGQLSSNYPMEIKPLPPRGPRNRAERRMLQKAMRR